MLFVMFCVSRSVSVLVTLKRLMQCHGYLCLRLRCRLGRTPPLSGPMTETDAAVRGRGAVVRLWCRRWRHHLNVDPTNDDTRTLVSASGRRAGSGGPASSGSAKCEPWLKAPRIGLVHPPQQIGYARQRGPSDARPHVSV